MVSLTEGFCGQTLPKPSCFASLVLLLVTFSVESVSPNLLPVQAAAIVTSGASALARLRQLHRLESGPSPVARDRVRTLTCTKALRFLSLGTYAPEIVFRFFATHRKGKVIRVR